MIVLLPRIKTTGEGSAQNVEECKSRHDVLGKGKSLPLSQKNGCSASSTSKAMQRDRGGREKQKARSLGFGGQPACREADREDAYMRSKQACRHLARSGFARGGFGSADEPCLLPGARRRIRLRGMSRAHSALAATACGAHVVCARQASGLRFSVFLRLGKSREM